MVVKIATVPTFDKAADVVVRVWQQAGKPKVLRFEGFDGVGKSGLAKLVASRIAAEHIEGDKFAFKPDVPTPYPGCLRREEFDAEISAAIGSGKLVVLDAVCLGEVAPSSRWGRGFVVYVKRLSFNNQDPIWHDGFHLEDEEENHSDEPHRGILQYHRQFRPHESADLIIEFPNIGHKIYNFAFDRSRCFDPAGAEVLDYRRM
jgi:hypothetical protein